MKEINQNFKKASSLMFALFLSVFVFAAGPSTSAVQVEGGTISTADNTSFCYSDDVADVLSFEVTGDSGPHSLWVATDPVGNILASNSNGTFDFTNAGPGECVVYHISFKAFIFPPLTGMNVGSLVGWFALSNGITVNRSDCDGMPGDGGNTGECTADGGMLSGGPFEFCVGDGEADNIGADQIVVSGGSGPMRGWVVTDAATGEILGLPPTFSAVNFDGAGVGVCYVWYIAHDETLTGAEVGANAADLGGCFSLSNPITVNRIDCTPMPPACDVDGGTLSGGPFEFCVGDGEADNIGADQIVVTGGSGPIRGWVVTDAATGEILGLPPTFSAVNFDGAGVGVCYVWYIAHDETLTGAEVGANAADLGGCFSLSNPITVNRIDCTPPAPVCDVDGGTLSGGPFEFCVGDGLSDMIAADQIVVTGGSGPIRGWVVTDAMTGEILGLPPTFSAVNFDGAGVGVCYVWYIAHDETLTGAEVGANAADLGGCFSLSNPITVNRIDCAPMQPVCDVDGGTLSGGPFQFCVGDGEADNIAPDQIVVTGGSGPMRGWVVTDAATGEILGLPPTFSAVNFDGAGVGLCFVWYIAHDETLTGAEVGANAGDLGGCFSLSNPISVNRIDCTPPEPVCDVDGGRLFGGPFEFCVGDGLSDMIGADQIVLDGASGPNSVWVVTDAATGEILGLPPTFSAVNFDGAGVGECYVWHLSYSGELGGAEVGANAAELSGCFDLSNFIAVIRNDCSPTGNDNEAPDTVGDAVGDACGVNSGTIQLCDGSGTNINICPSDGVDSSFEICVDDNEGADMFWVLLNPDRTLIAIQDSPIFDLEGFPAGLCVICHVSAEGDLVGLEPGLSVDDVQGCIDFSNEVSVSKFVDDPTYCFGVGLQEDESTLSFNTLGNPVQDILRLQVQSDFQGENRVIIYDILGRTLFNNVLPVKEGENTIEIDASEFDSGLHFINMTNGKSSAMETFVKDNN